MIEYVASAPGIKYTAPAPVIKDVTPTPADTCATPVPVIEHVMPAHVVIHTAPSPVTEDGSPAPAVTCAAPVPVFVNVEPAPVIEYIAPAPSVTVSTPSQQFLPAHTMATVTTGVSLDTTSVVDSRYSSSLDKFAAPVYNRVRQELFVAEETTQNPVEIPISSSTSASSDRLDELANMLDACNKQLSPLAAQVESIEKETERNAMLTKRIMEPPKMMEPERVPWKRRRRLRYSPMPGTMEHAVYLVPEPHDVTPTYARICTIFFPNDQ